MIKKYETEYIAVSSLQKEWQQEEKSSMLYSLKEPIRDNNSGNIKPDLSCPLFVPYVQKPEVDALG